MAVKRGTVAARQFVVEVDGQEYVVPKGCSTIKASQLRAIAGKEVEVLMSRDTVLAIRILDPDIKFGPIITCYLMPPDIVFDDRVLARIEPMITEQLVESGVLDREVAGRLREWHAEVSR